MTIFAICLSFKYKPNPFYGCFFIAIWKFEFCNNFWRTKLKFSNCRKKTPVKWTWLIFKMLADNKNRHYMPFIYFFQFWGKILKKKHLKNSKKYQNLAFFYDFLSKIKKWKTNNFSKLSQKMTFYEFYTKYCWVVHLRVGIKNKPVGNVVWPYHKF